MSVSRDVETADFRETNHACVEKSMPAFWAARPVLTGDLP